MMKCSNCVSYVKGFRATNEEPAEPAMCSKWDKEIDDVKFCLSFIKKIKGGDKYEND